jgi:hypothetical protein
MKNSNFQNPSFSNGFFYSPTKGRLSFEEIISEILGYIQEKPEGNYDVVVGCDSSSSDVPDFPLAVVVLRIGEGGRFFLKKISYPERKFVGWKTRILQEVLLSCDLALTLKDELQKRVLELDFLPNYEFRYIHADVGEAGATREMIKEVTGIIRGNGFEPKLKPESFAASNVADRYT